MRKTIAQRKVRRAEKKGSFWRLLPWILCPPLALLAYFLKFVIPGYSFSALVCCILIGLILFYALCARFPERLRPVRKAVTALLCVGLVVVGLTEAVIIRHSFGDPGQHCDYIVVLGAKVRHDGPSVSLWDRIHGAYDYLLANPESVAIVSGGQGLDEPMTEAKAMADELVGLGISPDRIWLEEQATNTRENLNYSLALIQEKTGTRPEKIGVVSSEYHLLRAKLVADQCSVEAVGIPAQTSRIGQKINHFMREVAGVWFYFLTGGE